MSSINSAHKKFNETSREAVLKALRVGATIDVAAGAAGISRRLLAIWIQAGREGKSKEFAQFFEDVNKAIDECTVKDLTHIDVAAERDWKAAAWRLSKRRPQDFGDHKEVALSGSLNVTAAGIFAELERRAVRGSEEDFIEGTTTGLLENSPLSLDTSDFLSADEVTESGSEGSN